MLRFRGAHYKQLGCSKNASRAVKWAPYKFKTTYTIPNKNKHQWQIDPRSLVLSRTKDGCCRLHRVSWHPFSGEMILGTSTKHSRGSHALDIHEYGSYPYDEYVGALVIPEKMSIYIFPWLPFSPSEKLYLEGHEIDTVSANGQSAMRNVLHSAGLPANWSVKIV